MGIRPSKRLSQKVSRKMVAFLNSNLNQGVVEAPLLSVGTYIAFSERKL